MTLHVRTHYTSLNTQLAFVSAILSHLASLCCTPLHLSVSPLHHTLALLSPTPSDLDTILNYQEQRLILIPQSMIYKVQNCGVEGALICDISHFEYKLTPSKHRSTYQTFIVLYCTTHILCLTGDRTEPPRTCTPRTLTPRTHTPRSLTPWTLTPWTFTP